MRAARAGAGGITERIGGTGKRSKRSKRGKKKARSPRRPCERLVLAANTVAMRSLLHGAANVTIFSARENLTAW